jgi:hypothetical protein
MFILPIVALINTINNAFLDGFPFMKNKLARNYLDNSPSTSKGK